MATQLTPQQQSLLNSLQATGRYADETQVLDEALELLRQRDDLREKLQVGIDQLNHGHRHSMHDVMEEIRQSQVDG